MCHKNFDKKKKSYFSYVILSRSSTERISSYVYFHVLNRELLDFRVLEDRQRRSSGLSWVVKCWKCYQTPPRLNRKWINVLFSNRWNIHVVNFEIFTFPWFLANEFAFFRDQVTFYSAQRYQVHNTFLVTFVIDSEADVSSFCHKLPSVANGK